MELKTVDVSVEPNTVDVSVEPPTPQRGQVSFEPGTPNSTRTPGNPRSTLRTTGVEVTPIARLSKLIAKSNPEVWTSGRLVAASQEVAPADEKAPLETMLQVAFGISARLLGGLRSLQMLWLSFCSMWVVVTCALPMFCCLALRFFFAPAVDSGMVKLDTIALWAGMYVLIAACVHGGRIVLEECELFPSAVQCEAG